MLLFTFLTNKMVKNEKVKSALFVLGALGMAGALLLVTFDKSVLGLVVFSGPILLMIFNNFNQRLNVIEVFAYLSIILIYAFTMPYASVELGPGFYVLCFGGIISMGVSMKFSHDLFWAYDDKLKEKIKLTEERNLAIINSMSELEKSEETIKSQYLEISQLNAANQQIIDQLKAVVNVEDDGIIDINLERKTLQITAKASQILNRPVSTPKQLFACLREGLDDGDFIAFNHMWDQLQFLSPDQTTVTTREFAYRDHETVKYIKLNGLVYATTLSEYGGQVPCRHMALIVKDVTSEHTKAKHIYDMAYIDSLTGLSNRTAFIETALEAMTLQKVEQVAVMVFDIDNFKYINDSFGFALGDELLKQVGKPLKACLEKTKECPVALLSVARFDGDTFGLMWCADEVGDISRQVYQWLVDHLSEQTLDQTHLHITFSAGVAESPDPNFALTAAEIAMYKTKERGRASFSKFDPNYLKEAQRHHQLTTALDNALEALHKAPIDGATRQLSLFYQPIYNTSDLTLSSYEALARWNHPILGAIAPDEFIAVAEKSGQILALGKWVQQEAMRFAKDTGNRVCVNVSPMQLLETDDYAGQLLRSLDDFNLPRDHFCIEITESVLVQDRARANQHLQELKDAGVPVSLDDFGSGYSSLSYLMDLPINTLKIDKAFIRPLTSIEQREARIVGTILQLATQLGLETVAEGVERQDQMEILKALGCTKMQGYLFSRPMPESEVPRI